MLARVVELCVCMFAFVCSRSVARPQSSPRLAFPAEEWAAGGLVRLCCVLVPINYEYTYDRIHGTHCVGVPVVGGVGVWCLADM